jgi:hypothetical protein
VLRLVVNILITSNDIHLDESRKVKLLLVKHEVINIISPIDSFVIGNMLFFTFHSLLCIGMWP